MNPKFEEAVKSIISMCVDVLQGGITEKTFISNLKTFVIFLEEHKEEIKNESSSKTMG